MAIKKTTTHGGAREGSGPKPKERKIPVTTYHLKSELVKKYGSLDKFKQKIYEV